MSEPKIRRRFWVLYAATLLLTTVAVTVIAALGDPFLAGYTATCCAVLAATVAAVSVQDAHRSFNEGAGDE